MSNEDAETNRSLSSLLILIILFLLNLLPLWLTSIRFRANEEIFYWQRLNDYFSGIWQLSCWLMPLLLGIWVRIERKKYRNPIDRFAFLVLMFFLCAFVNYFAIFVVYSVNHVGTVELKGNIYQLASITKYDDPVIYYLGKRDESGYKCEFHRIYYIHYSVIHKPEIELSNDMQRLVAKMNGEIVYTFDGLNETCKETYIGMCINNNIP